MIKSKQIGKSRQWIINSMLELLNEKEFASITITEICQKADLVRRTFYRYFKKKEDILSYYINFLYSKYLDECNDELDGASITYNYFNFWKEHSDFLNVLSKQKLLSIIMINYNEFITRINEKFFKNLKSSYTPLDVEYYCLFIAGGLWAILIKWVERGSIETPQEMAQKVKSLVNYKASANKNNIH